MQIFFLVSKRLFDDYSEFSFTLEPQRQRFLYWFTVLSIVVLTSWTYLISDKRDVFNFQKPLPQGFECKAKFRVIIVKTTIESTVNQYKDDTSVNPALLWEMIKLKVREKSISYAAFKNVTTRKCEEMLEHEIALLEKHLDNASNSNPSYHNVAERMFISTPEWNCLRPTPNSLAFFGLFQSEQNQKNKPYAQ